MAVLTTPEHCDCADALETLREVAHAAFHLLDDSEHSELRAACVAQNVDDLEAALQAFIDRFDPGGAGCTDAHDACFAIDRMVDRIRAFPSSRAWADVAEERGRQVAGEGFDAAHDDKHTDGELAKAAACYAVGNTGMAYKRGVPSAARLEARIGQLWPWALEWWKPKDRRRDLVRAGALILAEIERIDRAEEQSGHPSAEAPKEA